MNKFTNTVIALATCGLATADAKDTPRWGGTESNNMVSTEKNLPVDMEPGKRKKGSEEIDMATTKNVDFISKLGSQTYGTPTIAHGKIYVGTNNESPRNKTHTGDRGNVFALDEKTGEFKWQLVVPKLGAGKVSDWEFLGVCSSATIDGNRAYVVTNRCEILCMDTAGFADGNQGFQDEAKYLAGPGKPPVKVGDNDADIIWVFDMRSDELGVFPHNVASSSVVIVGDKLFATTSNGVDWTHLNIPAPQAPSMICLDKKTGKLISEEGAGVSDRVLHCSWASPAYGKIGDRETVVFGGGDGWCYGFSLEAEEDEDGFNILKEFWRYDCNPPEYRKDKDGKKIKYAEYEGPSEVVGSPVIYKNRVYTVIGQDPEHGVGLGMVSCIDATMSGDISGKAKWTFKGIERSMSTPSIADDLLYVADYSGRVYCLDANTGEKYWDYDTKGHIWSSTLVADGKVYVTNEEGEVHILKTGKKLEKLNVVEFPAPIYSSPVAANGRLYIATQTHLYAFVKGAEPKP